MTPPPRKMLSYQGLIVRWGRWVPLIVLSAVLMFSLVAAALVAGLTREQQQARFSREIAAHTSALRSRIDDFSNLLVAARAFWVSQPTPPTPQSFRAFSSRLDLETRYPDVQALGFISWERASGQPSVSGQPYRSVINFIAPPTTTNQRALGFDMYTDPIRRAAIEAARNTGEIQASDVVELVQDTPDGRKQRGFLMFAPVWRGESGTRVLQGFVYLALRVTPFITSLDASYGRDILTSRITINGHALTPDPLPGSELQRPLQLAGQRWQVAYAPPRSFSSEPLNWLSPLIALLGLLTSGIAFLLIRRQVVALETAEAANRDLNFLQQRQQQARAEFEAIFQAMQDAAAFTDPQGRVRLVNRAMTEQFRTAASDLVGHPLTLLHVDRRLDDRGTFQAITTPYQRSDGTRFYGEAQRNEVTDAGGERLGYIEVIRDVSERVSSDQALRNEERRSRAILDSVPHVVWVSSPLGDTTYVNTQHRERLHGAAVYERIHPDDRDTYERMWQDAYIHSRGAHCTVRIRMAATPSVADEENALEDHWFEVHVEPLYDELGKAREWVASATDIHDRLIAERNAQNSETRYRGVVEGMPQIVWLSDKEGQITYLNRRWGEFVGTGAGQDLLGTLHPDDRADYAARWHTAIENGRSFEAEHRLRSASGEYRAFVTRGRPIRGPQGEVMEWVGTMTDVDDSVYAENAARLLVDVTEAMLTRGPTSGEGRQERYKQVLRLVTSRVMEAATIWVADPDSAGEVSLSLLADCAGHPNWRLPHIVQTVQQLAQHVANTLEPEYVVAHPLLHAVEVSGGVLYPLVGLDGTARGVLGLAHRHPLHDRDHELILELAARLTTALENDSLREQTAAAQSELHQLNQSLEERVQRRTLELEEANRELEAFSYSVSHDLRTPLRHIVGFGDLLRKDAQDTLTPKGQRYLGVITDAAGRMSGLIDSLLEFSRMGRQPLRLVPVELGVVAERVWQSLEPDRQGRDVRLTLHPMPSVPGDPALLELVFQNLLSNAIKYSKTRAVAEVEISAQLQGNVVRIDVRDNGVGFDPKYAAKLFGVFQRLHRAEEFEGIGIGLANVRRIVARHGGQVSAESVQGEGATFTITLPLEQETLPGEEQR